MATTILATVTAKPECTADVEIALRNMIPVTRAEAGCLSYLLFRSDEQAGVFQLLESYADKIDANKYSKPNNLLLAR